MKIKVRSIGLAVLIGVAIEGGYPSFQFLVKVKAIDH